MRLLSTSAAIERLPIAVPTDFIVGVAGLGSVIAFALGFALRLRGVRVRRKRIDPLLFAGWGAGMGGIVASALWLVSLIWEVLF